MEEQPQVLVLEIETVVIATPSSEDALFFR